MKHIVVELYMDLVLAVERLGHIVATVGYRLYLADDAQHACHAHLALGTQAALGHTVKERADFHLHTV